MNAEINALTDVESMLANVGLLRQQDYRARIVGASMTMI